MKHSTSNIKYCPIEKFTNHSFVFEHIQIQWNEQVTFHQQETWELSYVMTSKGTRVIGGTMELSNAGEVILIPPQIPHGWYFDSSDEEPKGKIENISLFFPTELLDNCSLLFPELKEYVSGIKRYDKAISFSKKTLKHLQLIMRSMIHQSDVERLSSFIKLLAILSTPENTRVVGYPVQKDKNAIRLKQIYLYVLNHFQEDIKLEDVARLAGIDKSSFCFFFKKMTGQSFFTYLTDYRVRASCQMLKNTAFSIAEISIASGFKDIPYFNRVFKKSQNMSPSQYRNHCFNHKEERK